MTDGKDLIDCLESTIHNAKWANKDYTSCDVGFLNEILMLLKAQEPKTCNECKHYDAKAFSDLGGKCRNSRSCHYCYECDKSFSCNAWEGR